MEGHDHSSGVNHKLRARDPRNYCSFYDRLHLKPVFPQSENIVFVVLAFTSFFSTKKKNGGPKQKLCLRITKRRFKTLRVYFFVPLETSE